MRLYNFIYKKMALHFIEEVAMDSIFENQLLASFPVEVQNRLRPQLESVSLSIGKVLYESGEVLRYVYFPTCSIVSLLYVLDSGASAEIAMVGNEGLVGISAILGGASCNHRAVVQSCGPLYRIAKQRIIDELNLHNEALGIILRYTQSLLTQMSQTAVCNRHHTIEQQLCRWILTSIDRLPIQQLNMTQELIANLLGVRREGVTEAAGKLQKIGAIEYSRGHISVLNRAILEQWCCECYFDLKKETGRLLPHRINHNYSNNQETSHAKMCASGCPTLSVPIPVSESVHANTLKKLSQLATKNAHEKRNSNVA